MGWREHAGDGDFRLDDVDSSGDRVAARFSWSDASGKRHHWGQGLRIRDGKIVDMQDFAPGRGGHRTARLFRDRPEG
jgi:hypothetical protein